MCTTIYGVWTHRVVCVADWICDGGGIKRNTELQNKIDLKEEIKSNLKLWQTMKVEYKNEVLKEGRRRVRMKPI